MQRVIEQIYAHATGLVLVGIALIFAAGAAVQVYAWWVGGPTL